jgi:hypothetical protein
MCSTWRGEGEGERVREREGEEAMERGERKRD